MTTITSSIARISTTVTVAPMTNTSSRARITTATTATTAAIVKITSSLIARITTRAALQQQLQGQEHHQEQE